MPRSAESVPELCAAHDPPPSALARTVPPSPTAVHRAALAQLTAFRSLPVPYACLLHVAPPSAVRRIVPLSPTATQALAPAQLMPVGSPAIPELLIDQ